MGLLAVLGVVLIVVGAFGLLGWVPLSVGISVLIVVGGLLLVVFGNRINTPRL